MLKNQVNYAAGYKSYINKSNNLSIKMNFQIKTKITSII